MNPGVDLVMMSKASSAHLADMTQNAVRTALMGSDPGQLSITVIEQEPVVEYHGAATVYKTGGFNYNAFANFGARLGSAPHIVIANNDLTFEPGWLSALLAVRYPVVSPIDPGYPRQRGINANESGWLTGRHLSGWCFMITRKLWQEIGGFDETYPFWCSDDAFIEQLRRRYIAPMIVPTSRVHHKVSATLSGLPQDHQDDLTWRNVHHFNQDFGASLGGRNEHYERWKQQNVCGTCQQDEGSCPACQGAV